MHCRELAGPVDSTIQKMFDKSYIKEKAVKLLLSLSKEYQEVIKKVRDYRTTQFSS